MEKKQLKSALVKTTPDYKPIIPPPLRFEGNRHQRRAQESILKKALKKSFK